MDSELSLKVGPVETARRRRGWRQNDLAEAVGVAPSAISMIESGYRPAQPVRERIAQVLDAQVGELWPDPDAVAREMARRLAVLWGRLLVLLGTAFFKGLGPVGFEWTAAGRPAITVGGTTYFEAEDGRLVASRVDGGRAVFAAIGEDGTVDWSAAPLADPALN